MALPVCDHYAGSEALLVKSLALQARLGPVFDITADCEGGAPPGREAAHAAMVGALIASPANHFGRVGVRIHDPSQRHWHSKEDEFAMVVSGEVVLVTNGAETVMRPGDCAAFPKNDGDAHHFVNRSNVDAVLLVVGTNVPDDTCTYPDIDMHLPRNDGPFTRKDGSAF